MKKLKEWMHVIINLKLYYALEKIKILVNNAKCNFFSLKKKPAIFTWAFECLLGYMGLFIRTPQQANARQLFDKIPQ